MKYESSPSRLHATQTDAFVVLIVSESVKLPQNLETFSRIIKESSEPVRLFISVSTEADVALAEAASRLGLSFEILLSNEVRWEPIGGKSFRMPYAVKPETLDEIGLALTDGILVADDGKPARIVKRAGQLKKQLLEASKPISHDVPVSPFELLRGFDPEEGVRNRFLSSIVGRVEQGLLTCPVSSDRFQLETMAPVCSSCPMRDGDATGRGAEAPHAAASRPVA